MNNKKLFKTLTISAVSLATAAAAVVTPMAVLANKGHLSPSKKDGENASIVFKTVDGTAFTSTTLYCNGENEAPILFDCYVDGEIATDIEFDYEKIEEFDGSIIMKAPGTSYHSEHCMMYPSYDVAVGQTIKIKVTVKDGDGTTLGTIDTLTITTASAKGDLTVSQENITFQPNGSFKTVTVSGATDSTITWDVVPAWGGTSTTVTVTQDSTDLSKFYVTPKSTTGMTMINFYAEGYATVSVLAQVSNHDALLQEGDTINIKIGSSITVHTIDEEGTEITGSTRYLQFGTSSTTGGAGRITCTPSSTTNEITVTAQSDSTAGTYEGSLMCVSASDSYNMTMVNAVLSDTDDLVVDQSTISLEKGDTTTISITDNSGNEVTEGVTITSSGAAASATQVTGTNQWIVSGLAAGTNTLTIAKDGYTSATCEVTVENATAALKRPDGNICGKVGGNTFTAVFTSQDGSSLGSITDWNIAVVGSTIATAAITSVSGSSLTVTFTSGTAVGASYVNIWNTNTPDVVTSADFFVYAHTMSILGKSSDYLSNKTQALTATLDDTASESVSWKSLDPNVATVSSTGLVTYLNKTSDPVTIRAYATDDIYSFADIAITITEPTLDLFKSTDLSTSIKGTTINDKVNNTGPQLALKDTASSGDLTTHDYVTWSSSDDAVATVSSTGLVTYVGAGDATITATFSTSTVKGTYTTSASVTFHLSTYIFEFYGADGTEEYSTYGTLPKYTSNTMAAGKVLYIRDKDTQAASSLSDFTYVVTKISGSVTPIEISAAGVVTHKGAGKALITAESTTDLWAPAFYAIYEVSDSAVTIKDISSGSEAEWANTHKYSEAIQLKAKLDDTDVPETGYTIAWTSSDESVATIDSDGNVTFLKFGETNKTTITCTVTNTTSKLTCVQTLENIYVLADDLEADPNAISGKVGDVGNITMLVNDEEVSTSTGKFAFVSSAPTIASVNETSGAVTLLANGTAVITVTYTARAGGATQQTTVDVSVYDNVLYLNYTWIKASVGRTAQLIAYDSKGAIEDLTALTFTSGDAAIASVDNTSTAKKGTVTLVSPGTTNITVTYKPSGTVTVTQTCKVTVSESSLVLNKSVVAGYISDEGETLEAYYNGVKLTSGVTWSCPSAAVSVGESTGVLSYTGITTTAAVVTATYTDGQGNTLTATCNVTVADIRFDVNCPSTVKGISNTSRVLKSYINGIEQANATSCGNGTVTYASNNEAVAKFDTTTANKLMFVAAGTATITVTWSSAATTLTHVVTITVRVLK